MGYVKEISPKKSQIVRLDLDIQEVIQVDDIEGNVEIRFELILRWADERLEYRNLKFERKANPMTFRDMKRIWTPRITFLNSVKFEGNEIDQKTSISLEPNDWGRRESLDSIHEMIIFDGFTVTLNYEKVFIEKFRCQFDLTMFPFDRTVCRLLFGLPELAAMKLQPTTTRIQSSVGQPVGVFEVENITLLSNDDHSTVVVEIILKRSPISMVSTMYLPTFCLLTIVHLTHYFPLPFFRDKISITLTCMLVLSTLFVSTNR